MMLQVPGVLDQAALGRCREILGSARWSDGRITAGPQSAKVKRNLQLDEDCPGLPELRERVLAGLEKSALFLSAALPQRVFPPLFNRYEPGMSFGSHVDNALRPIPGGGTHRLRTDLAATLFLNPPEEYQGGELVVEDTFGSHAVKLPAGDLVLYPASSMHHITQVESGVRLACFFWIQSMVRDPGERALLFDLDLAAVQVSQQLPDSPISLLLSGVYHNLLRRWSEP